MGKKGIEDLIEEMDYFIDTCKVQPFSNNKISVPKDEIKEMLSELRMKLPVEIERCQKVMRNKDAILNDAKIRSDQVIAAANAEAAKLVDQNEIVRQAQEKAQQIIDEAVATAQQIMDNANEDGDTIRVGALHYTNETLKDIGEFIQRLLEEETQKTQGIIAVLNEMMGTVNTNRSQITEQLQAAETGDNDKTTTSAMQAPLSATLQNPPNAVEDVDEEVSKKVMQAVEESQSEDSSLEDAVQDMLTDEN